MVLFFYLLYNKFEVKQMKIFIGCSSSNDISNEYRDDCNKLLNILFEEDNELVFGASDTGIMGDAYNVALSNKRNVIGICPELYKDDFKKLKCNKEITTKVVSERTDGLIKESDVLLFLPGGVGTVYEFFSALESKRSHEHSKKIIIYNCNNYFDELIKLLEKMYSENFTSIYVKDMYFISSDINEIVKYINDMDIKKG